MKYPENHQQVVGDLLAGKFVHSGIPLLATIKSNEAFYTDFFKKSFGYHLHIEEKYAFLSSKQTKEQSTRDLLLMLALLAHEYHHERKDFFKEIEKKVILVEDLQAYLKRSSKYNEVIKGTQAEDLPRFLDMWHRRYLIEYTRPDHSGFRFLPPVHAFLSVALALAEEQLIEST